MPQSHPFQLSVRIDGAIALLAAGIVFSIVATQTLPHALGPWVLLLAGSLGLLVRDATAAVHWPVVLALALALPPESAVLVALLPALAGLVAGVVRRRTTVLPLAEFVALLCSILVAVAVAAGVQDGASVWRLVVGGALAGALLCGLRFLIQGRLGGDELRWVVSDTREDMRDALFGGATAALLGHLAWMAMSGEGGAPWPVLPWVVLPAVMLGLAAVVAVELSRHGGRVVVDEAVAAHLMAIEIESLARRGHVERVLRLSLAVAAGCGLSARRRTELATAMAEGTSFRAGSVERNIVAIATAYDVATTPRPGGEAVASSAAVTSLRTRFGGIEDAAIIRLIEDAVAPGTVAASVTA